jgi:hypothetical protein
MGWGDLRFGGHGEGKDTMIEIIRESFLHPLFFHPFPLNLKFAKKKKEKRKRGKG